MWWGKVGLGARGGRGCLWLDIKKCSMSLFTWCGTSFSSGGQGWGAREPVWLRWEEYGGESASDSSHWSLAPFVGVERLPSVDVLWWQMGPENYLHPPNRSRGGVALMRTASPMLSRRCWLRFAATCLGPNTSLHNLSKMPNPVRERPLCVIISGRQPSAAITKRKDGEKKKKRKKPETSRVSIK